MAGMNFKSFEAGQDVRIFKGKNKGTEGTCLGMDEETGKVEIELADGKVIFAANGTVDWIKNEFYDPNEFDLEFEEVEHPAVEPPLSEYARDPEVIEEDASLGEYNAAVIERHEEAGIEPGVEYQAGDTTVKLVTPESREESEAPAPKKTNAKIEAKPCQCGCGEMANRKRMFRPGHDQAHKGNLIRAMQGGSEEAENELRKRGWRTDAEIEALKAKGKNQPNLNPENLAAIMAELEA